MQRFESLHCYDINSLSNKNCFKDSKSALVGKKDTKEGACVDCRLGKVGSASFVIRMLSDYLAKVSKGLSGTRRRHSTSCYFYWKK